MSARLLLVLAVALLLQLHNAAAAPTSITITQPFLVPENFEYIPSRGFIVTSITGQGVHYVNDTGHLTLLNSLKSVGSPGAFGVQVDLHSNLLYVATGKYPFNASQTHQAGMVTIDLHTNRIIRNVDFTNFGDPAVPHVANDMDVDLDGNVFVVDSKQGVIYKVTKYGAVSIYAKNAMFSSPVLANGSNPNPLGVGLDGITFLPGSYGKYFLVGIYNTASGGVSTGARILKVSHPVGDTVTEVTLSGDTMYGADAIYPFGGKLYVAGNAGVNDLYTLTSTDGWVSATVSTTVAPSPCVSPTAPVARDGNIYVSCAAGFHQGPYHIVKVTSATPTTRQAALEVSAEYITAALSGDKAKAGSLIDPSIKLQWHGSSLVPGAGSFSGLQGYGHFFQEAFTHFKDISFTGAQFVGTSDSGLTVLQHYEHSVATATGKQISDLAVIHLYKVDTAKGKLTNIDTFTDSLTVGFKTCAGVVVCDPFAEPQADTEWPAVPYTIASVSDASLSTTEKAAKDFAIHYFQTFAGAIQAQNLSLVLPLLDPDVVLHVHAPAAYYPASGLFIGAESYLGAFAATVGSYDGLQITDLQWAAVSGNHVIGTWLETVRFIKTGKQVTNARKIVHYTTHVNGAGNRVMRKVDVFIDTTKYAAATCPGTLVCSPPYKVNMTAALTAAVQAVGASNVAPTPSNNCPSVTCKGGASVAQVVLTVLITGIVLTGTAMFSVYSMMSPGPTSKPRSHSQMVNLNQPLMTSDSV